jgi:hypothetical protein
VLKIGGESVAFLAEKDTPKDKEVVDLTEHPSM